MRKDGTLSYLLTDHLGSNATVLNSIGTVVSNERYWPFGGTRSGLVGTDKQYTGQRREPGDNALDLYNYGARFYSTVLGRFLSVDPVISGENDPQAWNGYAYVRNNPLRFTDPTGKCIPDYDGPRGCGLMPLPTEDSSGSSRLSPAEQKFWDDAQCIPCFELERLADVSVATGFSAWTWMVAAASGDAAGWLLAPHDMSTWDTIWVLDAARYPGTATHVAEAIANGQADILTIGDPADSAARGRAALRGIPTSPGFDRDEFPPKKFEEGGRDAHVDYVVPSDNRGAGSSMGRQLRGFPEGTRVRVEIRNSVVEMERPVGLTSGLGGAVAVLAIFDIIINAYFPPPGQVCC